MAFGERVGDAIWEGKSEYAHGMTYAGHPVCAAVALENIKIIEEEGLATRAAGPIGDYFRDALMTLGDHPLVGEVRSCGLIACVELCADKETRRPFEPAGRVGLLCRDFSIRNGLVMRAIRDGMVLSPPLVISEAEIDEIVVKVRRSLEQTADALAR